MFRRCAISFWWLLICTAEYLSQCALSIEPFSLHTCIQNDRQFDWKPKETDVEEELGILRCRNRARGEERNFQTDPTPQQSVYRKKRQTRRVVRWRTPKNRCYLCQWRNHTIFSTASLLLRLVRTWVEDKLQQCIEVQRGHFEHLRNFVKSYNKLYQVVNMALFC